MIMNFQVRNVGNIRFSDIILKPLTIIAGENSTGKTFVTKSMYALLHTHALISHNLASVPGKDFNVVASHLFEKSLKKNFQIKSLKRLICAEHTEAMMQIEHLGLEAAFNESETHYTFAHPDHSIGNVIFFDSPIYIKIRKALQGVRNSGLIMLDKEDNYLKGYPDYVDELLKMVDEEYIEKPDFKEISDDIHHLLNGRLVVNDDGNIVYLNSDNQTIPLSLTAMGIGNIGVIDLLLRNNFINKGAYLIMDEPEVHLHPQWQVKLAEILYKLAKNGANVVIATHSLDLLKAFQIILQENETEAEQIIAFNKMPYSSDFAKKSEREKVDQILDDLSQPFYDLYMRSV